jgi:hypothetical protein
MAIRGASDPTGARGRESRRDSGHSCSSPRRSPVTAGSAVRWVTAAPSASSLSRKDSIGGMSIAEAQSLSETPSEGGETAVCSAIIHVIHKVFRKCGEGSTKVAVALTDGAGCGEGGFTPNGEIERSSWTAPRQDVRPGFQLEPSRAAAKTLHTLVFSEGPRGKVRLERSSYRQHIIHHGREPESTGKPSYPHSPQVRVNERGAS